MRTQNQPKVAIASLLTLLAAATASTATAQDKSWKWPLYQAVPLAGGGLPLSGEPRPAIWGSTGELQNSFDGAPYLHPGSDFRGNAGDPFVIPVDGEILRTFNQSDACKDRASCRVWFSAGSRGSARHIYYVSHIDIEPNPTTPEELHMRTQTEVRVQLEAAVAGTPVAPNPVSRGQRVAGLADFGRTRWHHLHLGIFDTERDYALVNTLDFFEQNPMGDTGASLITMDDEKPVIIGLDLVRDGEAATSTALVSGTCGDTFTADPAVADSELLDLMAHAFDTFYTTGPFADFPGKSTLNPDTGIRRASYQVREVATGSVIQEGTWFDLAETPSECGADESLACTLPGSQPTLSEFFQRMENEEGAPSSGLSVLDQLYDVDASSSDYSVPGGEQYYHRLTHAGAVNGHWDTSNLENGRYQVSAVVEDFAGNKTSSSLFVTLHQPGTTLDTTQPGFGDVYLQDHAADQGALPSNAAGEAFWNSSDILVVPGNIFLTDEDADGPAVQSLVTVGEAYNVYVRLRNNGCNPISGVKAQISASKPQANNIVWAPVTPPGVYVGSEMDPDGVTAISAGPKLLGPFTWIPEPDETSAEGHSCLLVAVDSSADPGPLGPALGFDVPNNNNVAQRNLSVGSCSFELPNSTTSAVSVGLRLVTNAAVENAETVDFVLPFQQVLFDLWQGQPGVAVLQNGSTMIVRMQMRDVTLPAFSLNSGASLAMSFTLDLPPTGGNPNRFVELHPTVNGSAVSGFTCHALAPPIVK